MTENIYEIYGKQMIQLEILQSQIAQTKQKIAEEINKPKEEEVENA